MCVYIFTYNTYNYLYIYLQTHISIYIHISSVLAHHNSLRLAKFLKSQLAAEFTISNDHSADIPDISSSDVLAHRDYFCLAKKSQKSALE